MRPTAAGTLPLLLGPQRTHAHRVEIQTDDGVWRDVTLYWKSFTWGGDADAGAESGTLTLRREAIIGGVAQSLAPLVGASPLNNLSGDGAPLLTSFARVRISSGVAAVGSSASASTVVFHGVIDDPQWGGRASVVTCAVRDLAAVLQDSLIRTERDYGSDDGTPIETVLQALFDDNGFTDPGDGSFTVAVLGDTQDWSLSPFTQKRGVSVWDAARELALKMGWDFRYWWHPDGSYRPTLLEPRRDTTTADVVLTAAQFIDIPQLKLNATDVRNYLELSYTDRAAAEVRTVVAQDLASIAAYGLRAAGIAEDAASNIDTEDEAQQMADAAVADLATPFIEQDAVLPYLWPVQLGDVLQFPPSVFYDEAQRFGVAGYRHELTPTSAKTTVTLRGRPVGAFKRWLALLGFGAVADPKTAPETIQLTALAFIDSADGLSRTYTWTRGKSVAFVWVLDRLLPVPVSAEPWPAVTDPPTVVLRDGEDAYTALKPGQGFQRFVLLVPIFKIQGGYGRGPVVKIILDPAPVALAATLKATVTGDTADLTLSVTGGATDWPVTAEVFEDDPDTAAIATAVFTAAGTRTKANISALGARALPLREVRHWYVRLVNSAGEVRWGSPALADRDALPQVQVTWLDDVVQPVLIIAYDDDTDAVRLTTPSGVKTWTSLSGSGVLLYEVGATALDAGGVEPLLTVGATRTGYTLEAEGGGTWAPFWSDGVLHGPPATPPVVRPRAVANAARSAEDVYALLETYAPERLTLRVRDGEGLTAPIYHLVASAVDTTPRYVASGTEIGPESYFTDGVGAPVAKLSAVSLVRDQIRRLYLQAVGEDSGALGAWVPQTLSLLEQPYLESVAATWDDAAGLLRVRVKGGPHTASVTIEADDDAAFGSPLSAFTSALADGGEVVATFALTGAQRGKVWHARATPWNLAGETGLSGVSLVDETPVPASFGVTVEVPTNDSVRVTVTDPGAVLDPTLRVKFYVTVGNGARTLTNPTAAPPAGVTTGTFTLTIVQDPKHTTLIEPVLYLRDGTQDLPGGQTLDADTQAQVLNLSAAYAGGVGTVTAVLDSDAALGAGNAEISFDGGSSWATLTVPSSRVVQTSVALSTSAKTPIAFRARNAQGEWGPTQSIELSRYDATSSGPTLNVTTTPGAFTYTVSYTASGPITYKVNGVTTSLPASPFAVSRPGAGGTPTSLDFSVTQSGQTVAEHIDVPAVDADTVAPDVQLIPSSVSTTQIVFTAYAQNPKTSGFVNATFTFNDCSGTVGGSAVSPGVPFTALANGIVVTATRPLIGGQPGSVKMRATISGGGSAEINRTVSEQTKDFTAPVFTPFLSVSNATSYTFAWSTPFGANVYAQTDNAGFVFQSGTSYTVSRNPAGGAAKVVVLKAIGSNGIETPVTFTVPPQESAGGGGSTNAFSSFSILPVNYTANTFALAWAGTFPAGSTFRIWVTSSNRGNVWNDDVTTSGTSWNYTTDEDITPGGGSSVTYKFYIECESGAAVVARSAVRSFTVTY